MENKCVVLLSGGQDSTTCLAWAKKNFKEVEAVSIFYRQRHQRELECATKICEISNTKQTIIDCTCLSKIAKSNLVTKDGDISQKHELDNTLPASFVPNRNMIFLSLVASYAYSNNIFNIVTGVCVTDYSGYPDCRNDFIESIQHSISLALGKSIAIHTPLMFLSKADIVMLMKELGHLDWYKYTNTCYEGFNPPCGKCPACIIREKGFREAGIIDPLNK